MMKIFFSIILNSSILFLIQFLLNTPNYPDSVIVTWWAYWWQVFLLWWMILWLLNLTIKPILKILWLPFLILMHWLFSLFINGAILWLLQKIINDFLWAYDLSYIINWKINFLFAVAIFTILNILYSLLFLKK